MKSIYQRLLDAGIPKTEFHNYYSDLYVPVTPTSTEVIKAYALEFADDPARRISKPFKAGRNEVMPEIFQSQIPGEGRYYDIPFAYDTYWAAKTQVSF